MLPTDSKYKIHFLMTAAVMAFIFVQSALPGDISGSESGLLVLLIARLTGLDGEGLSVIVRKLAHFTEFLVLGLCLGVNVRDVASKKSTDIGPLRQWLIPWLIGTGYALTDEIHQIFVPERACAFLDMCIDSAGVASGALIMAMIVSGRGRR